MFTQEQRRIFEHDGRFYDPSAVYRKLTQQTAGQFAAILEQYQAGEQDMGALAAAEELVSATVIAFELEPFDKHTGTGTLQDEALALLAAFLTWREEKKTPAANSPTSAPATAPAGSPPAPSPARMPPRSTLRPTTVSPLTRNASVSRTPSPSPGG